QRCRARTNSPRPADGITTGAPERIATMTEQETAPQAPPEEPAKLRPVLDVILEVAGHPSLPDGYDTWGWKIVRPDFCSHGGFRLPWPGGAVTDPAPIANDDPCPATPTGGFCC